VLELDGDRGWSPLSEPQVRETEVTKSRGVSSLRLVSCVARERHVVTGVDRTRWKLPATQSHSHTVTRVSLLNLCNILTVLDLREHPHGT
jgi:hypothetical protein